MLFPVVTVAESQSTKLAAVRHKCVGGSYRYPFEAQDMRHILKQRAACMKAGFPLHHPIIITLDEIRDRYVQQVGIATYFKQMVEEIREEAH